ncbi:phage tail tape measure protein [Marinobacter bryozoorum]|uniref:phage tail tape measure protein n=1 Tax=Marinobacter bryozoorum TaxID=256324 RepID=UPI002003FA22|nr:phage tail tape measure protein [Marinobacter bryozoorum]MCK7542973.1 phage tail tape measure protein [Marinobacter bryozoorum]
MADKSKTVEIIFGGVDRTGSAIGSVGKNLDALQNKVGNITGPLADVTDSILQLDAALAAAAIAVTGYAVKLSDEFDTAFGEIATLIGQPADNLGEFQAQLQEYSESSSQSLSEITSATYAAISAGVDYKDSIQLIAAAEQLAMAGRADLGATTTALVSTLNAYGASADEAAGYADDFFTTVQLGQTTIPELAAAMGRLSPIAAAAGLDFEEMAAAIATITAETGTGTAEAITGIRAAISNLIKPTSDAAKLADELGIEFNAAALESKGFSGVLEDVSEATGGNTELMARLFTSVEALTPVLALTGNASEVFAENLAAMQDNSGAARDASDELRDSLSLLTQALQNNLNSALITFGGTVTDETRSIVESMTGIFGAVGDELKLDNGVFAPLLEGIDGLATDIDEKLQTIARNFPEALSGIDLSDLLEAFGDLGDEAEDLFVAIFGNIDLATVEGLQEALQKVVDAFTALVNISAGVLDGLEPLFILIGEGVERFQELDGEAKKSIGQLLGLAKSIDTVLPAVGGLASGLESIGTGLTAMAGAQGFKALIGNLNSVKTLAAGAGKYGLIGLALAGGYGVGTLIDEYIIGPIEDKFGTSIGSWLYEQLNAAEIAQAEASWKGYSAEVRRSAGDLENIREINEIFNRTLTETTTATKAQQDEWQNYADSLVDAANEQEGMNDSLETLNGNQRESTNALGRLSDAVAMNGDTIHEVSDATVDLAENNRSLKLEYDETTGKINSFSGGVIRSGKAMDEAAEKTRNVIEESEEYRLKLLEIASDERIAQIEAKVSLDIAEVEANATKVVALAESISDTFASTGDVIASLFGSDAPEWDKFGFETREQIRKENKMREEAFELQKDLTKAEIQNMKEKTKALRKGDSLIKVDGAGLQPHLEAFMFEILREIQVRVNAEGEEMLLGLGAG